VNQHRKWIIGGVILLVISIVGGLIGTVLGIQHSFNELDANQMAGIGPIGAGLKTALASTIGAIVGSLIGLGSIGIGVVRYSRRQ
jgi:hypothetical protein